MSDNIHVGKVGEEVFIAVPPAMHERVRLPLSERDMHAFRFSVGDARWLIGALKKELRIHHNRTRKVAGR